MKRFKHKKILSMIIGVMTIQICMNGITSLKEKRSIIKSLVNRTRNKFNVSIAEVDHHDNKRTSVLGISVISNEGRFINEQFETIIKFMKRDGRFYLGAIERETFNA
ncbi:MAG: DUF503 domain-containing protein [Planctomycetota bacterium]